jgi:hypothetical protein
MTLDKSQITLLCDAMLGYRSLGVDSEGSEITAPEAPALTVAVKALLGDLTPLHAADVSRKPYTSSGARAAAFADLLRTLADGISPRVDVKADDDLRNRERRGVTA